MDEHPQILGLSFLLEPQIASSYWQNHTFQLLSIVKREK